jgi:acyl-CoA thioesterase-2
VTPQPDTDDALDRSILDALDALLRALELEPLGPDRFRVHNEHDRFGRVFGGQMIAQALCAASATVPDKPPHSLHAYFVQSGNPELPLELSVERARDGHSMSARHMTVTQSGRPLLIAMASFHDNPTEPVLADPPPVPGPDELPRLQRWVEAAPADLLPTAQTWITSPPPLDMRIGEPTYFIGGPPASGPRSHWMRLPRDVGDDSRLHSVLLAYSSDYLLLDMALRSHPDRLDATSFTGFSVDHALWLHRPVRFDQWHLHTQELLAISGHRGLVRGTIHDTYGHLVASTTQEVLVRASS